MSTGTGTGTPDSSTSTVATSYNWPWATAVEIAQDMASHFAGVTGFTDGYPVTLSASLEGNIEEIRDTYAQPLILSYLSRREHELLTHVHEYLVDPVLGADGTTTTYALSLTATTGTIKIYENLSGPWADRTRSHIASTSKWAKSSNNVVYVTAPTESTRIIAEYDHTSIPKDLKRWTRVIAGYQYLLAHVYVGDDPNVVPEMLRDKYEKVMAELEYIRSSGSELSISEFKTLRYHEVLDDTMRKSSVVEMLRR